MSDSDSSSASSAGSIIEDASEPDTTSFKCLFCPEQHGSVSAIFNHCASAHNFPVQEKVGEIGSKLGDIGVIKLINYLRLEAQEKSDPTTIVVTPDALADDKYLTPTLSDDPLLFEIGDFLPDTDEKPRDYDEYEAALSKNLPDNVEKLGVDDRDERYFDSYKGNSIHREMIEDRVRTDSYRDFITLFDDLFQGKTVLDVGCGTGILSLFCARNGGAKKVFAVDNSDIAVRAREIVKKNEEDFPGVIEVIQGRVEDFHTQRAIGDRKVDIIISEWMGYGLLFEGMLDSVLRARDLYLKPGGIMAPSHCTLRIAPLSGRDWVHESRGDSFWLDVYGFDFSPMIPGGAVNEQEIAVLDVPKDAVCGEASTFYEIDISTITVKELDFTASFELKITRDAPTFDGFTIWFDTFFLRPDAKVDLKAVDARTFEESTEGSPGVAFSTGPFGKSTHWHQAVFLRREEDRWTPLRAGTVMKGTVTYRKRRRDVRGIEVDITFEAEGVNDDVSGKLTRHMA